MSRSDHRMRSKKAGLSGLFRARLTAAALLLASATIVSAEPLAIEVTDVTPVFDKRTNQPAITFKLTPASARQFAELTAKNIGRILALRIDGNTVMIQPIQKPIVNAAVQVSGEWTLLQAKDIADRIAAGQSKVEVDVIND